MKYLFIPLIILAFACSTKKGVFYSEMSKVLVVKYEKNKLILHTGNSKDHSAYLIYDITTKADKNKKELYIYAWQAPGKEYKDRFEIDVLKLGIENIQEYKVIWVDPDGKFTHLQPEFNK